MKITRRNGGYSTDTAKSYVDAKQPIRLLSTQLEEQVLFENGKPTEDVAAYKAWFTQKGLPPFTVKFAEKIKLPAYMALVNFDNLQACEVNYNVYFKADGIKEVK